MPSLIVVGKKEGAEVTIADDVTVIGRDRGVGLELGDFQVSRRHALVLRTDDGCFVKDLGSRNGILVNKDRVPARRHQRLKNGDVLTVGKTSLIFKDVAVAGESVPAPGVETPAEPIVARGRAAASPDPGLETPVAPILARPVDAAKPAAKSADGASPRADGKSAPRPAKAPAAPAAKAVAAAAPALSAPVVATPKGNAAKTPEAPKVPGRPGAESPKRFAELAADEIPPAPEAEGDARGRGEPVALRQLLRRAETERVFYRNLALGLVGFLVLVLVALLFYSLGRRESRGDDAPARSGKASRDVPADGPPKVSRVPVAVPLGRAGELDAAAFASSVHPVLLGSCATSGCHIAPVGAGDLALEARTDEPAIARNLDRVRRFVVPGFPDRSVLLTKVLRREDGGEAHGGGPVLATTSPQYLALRAWIASAAPSLDRVDSASARLRDGSAIDPSTAPAGDRPRPRPAFGATDADAERLGAALEPATPGVTARILASAVSAPVGTPITLDGNGSTATGPMQFAWTLVERPEASRIELVGPRKPQAGLVPDAVGTYLVVLVVTAGGVSSAPERITIEAVAAAATRSPAAASPATAPRPGGRRLADDPAGRAYARKVFVDLLGRGPRADEIASALAQSREELVADLFTRDELYSEWYEQELLYFLLIDNFRPADDPADVARRLKAKELSVKDAIHSLVVGQYFNQRNPGNDTFVTVVLEQLLGLKVQDRANRKHLDAGKKMYDGASSTLLGKSGKSQADVVKIVVSDPGFFEHLVRRTHRRVTGSEIEPADLKAALARVESDENAFFDLEREWVLSSRYVERASLARSKSERAFTRGLFVDVLGKVPDEEDLRNARNALRSLADPGPLKAVLAKVLLDSPRAGAAAAREAGDAEGFVRAQFQRLLARDPKPRELNAFAGAVQTGTAPATIVRALVTSTEYEGY